MAELHDSKEPVHVTEQGQPSAYLVDVQDYEMMQNRLKILDGLSRGETLQAFIVIQPDKIIVVKADRLIVA